VEIALPALTLAGVIWTLRVLLPQALRVREPLALVCAALTVAMALSLWLLLGFIRLS